MNPPLMDWLRRSPRRQTLAADLRRQWEADPQALVRAIVRVEGEANQYATVIESMGLRVRHAFTLMPALAVIGEAAALLRLAAQPWVIAIELDRAVHTTTDEEAS